MHHGRVFLLEKAKVLSGVRWRDDFSPAAKLGALNALKGKYFELWVHFVLTHKKVLGAVVLQQNECVMLAESHVQAGWDMKIFNRVHNFTLFFQLKATRSVPYVAQALVKYPHYRVLATSEVAQKISKNRRKKTLPHSGVLDSGVKNADLENWLIVQIFRISPEAFFQNTLAAPLQSAQPARGKIKKSPH